MDKYGLTGTQLELKLSYFIWLEGRLKSEKRPSWLIRLFGVMNAILGSLSKVFLPLEAVKEFKEIIEQMILKREVKSK